jgi:hypothetical protein
MSKTINQTILKTNLNQLADVTKTLYGTHAYSAGYFQSMAELMFANLSKKQQEHYNRVLQQVLSDKITELKQQNLDRQASMTDLVAQ